MNVTQRRDVQGIFLRFALTLCTLALFGSPAIAQTYLYNRADFPTGNAPSAVVAGDFNGDGKLDLAVTNQGDNTVSILLGKPDGSFGAKTDFATAMTPRALVAADFNGDGKLDLAGVALDCTPSTCAGPGFVSILIGNGDGTFQSHVDYQVGGEPIGVIASDFNSDGKVDLAVANNLDSTISLLLGNGDGTFQSQSIVSLPGNPQTIAAGDFNGDGKQDLIVLDGNVSVLLSNGDGTFNRVDTTLAPYGSVGIAVGDFNGDGKLDAVVGNSSTLGAYQPQVLLGNGDGSFQPPSSTAIFTSFASADFIYAADFNRDGILDLAFTGHGVGAAAAIALGNGDGTFQYTNLILPVISATPYTPAVIGDFNGDGLLDLAEVNPLTNTVDVLLGDGDGTFGRESTLQAGAVTDYVGPELVADFNSDGKSDVAVEIKGGTTPAISVLLGNGDGTLQAPVSTPVSGTQSYALVAGDFNGDGKEDLAADAGSAVAVLLGNGDGSLQVPISTTLASTLTVNDLVAGDFNGDGKTDLAAIVYDSSSGRSSVVILPGAGDGTFTVGLSYGFNNGPIYSLVAADLNADGKLDLAVVEPAVSLVAVLIGNGDGSFQNPVTYAVSSTNVLSAGDVNGDGKLDLVLASGSSTSVLLGNGDGTFQNHIDSIMGSFSSYTLGSLALADFNGDGRLDLATYGEGSADVLLGNGDGTFRQPLAYHPAFTSGSVTAGDFTSDGTADLAVASFIPSGSYPAVSLLVSAPSVALFPSPLEFALQYVQSPSAPQNVLLTNVGNAPLSLSGVTTTGDYSQTNACSGGVALGASCNISVTFTPTTTGTRTGTLVIADNALSSPQVVGLTGMGTDSRISLSPATLAFGNQSQGSTSPAQVVTLTNTGTAPADFNSMTASGDFAETNNCGSSVAAGANCAIYVTFTPTATGTRTGTLTITDNASGSPQTVALSGTGVAPLVSLSVSTLTFANQNVGTTSAAQVVTLTNSGNATLNISAVAVTGDFAQTNTCGSSVAVGASCTISATFTPTTAGTRTGTLTITDDASGSPQIVSLTGTGVGPAVTLSATTLAFATQVVGTSSGAQSVTLTNSGNAGLTITSLAASGDFVESNTCGSSVAAGASCTISATFKPTAGGSRTGTLTITDNASGTPQTVALSGTGEDFSIGAASGSSTSATVTAGATATYQVSISPGGGLTGSVSFACTGAPSEATCTANPATVTLNGSSAATTKVSVTTTAASMTSPRGPGNLPPPVRPPALLIWWLMLLALAAGFSLPFVRGGLPISLGQVPAAATGVRADRWHKGAGRKHAAALLLATTLLLAVVCAACGGGGGSTTLHNPGTPAGNYTLTVTATYTSGSTTLTHSEMLKLTVN